jgi:hypothetical protein
MTSISSNSFFLTRLLVQEDQVSLIDTLIKAKNCSQNENSIKNSLISIGYNIQASFIALKDVFAYPAHSLKNAGYSIVTLDLTNLKINLRACVLSPFKSALSLACCVYLAAANVFACFDPKKIYGIVAPRLERKKEDEDSSYLQKLFPEDDSSRLPFNPQENSLPDSSNQNASEENDFAINHDDPLSLEQNKQELENEEDLDNLKIVEDMLFIPKNTEVKLSTLPVPIEMDIAEEPKNEGKELKPDDEGSNPLDTRSSKEPPVVQNIPLPSSALYSIPPPSNAENQLKLEERKPKQPVPSKKLDPKKPEENQQEAITRPQIPFNAEILKEQRKKFKQKALKKSQKQDLLSSPAPIQKNPLDLDKTPSPNTQFKHAVKLLEEGKPQVAKQEILIQYGDSPQKTPSPITKPITKPKVQKRQTIVKKPEKPKQPKPLPQDVEKTLLDKLDSISKATQTPPEEKSSSNQSTPDSVNKLPKKKRKSKKPSATNNSVSKKLDFEKFK